jgi:hypothetical protein
MSNIEGQAKTQTIQVSILIRSTSRMPFDVNRVFEALSGERVSVVRVRPTSEGLGLICRGEVRDLRLTAERLAGLPLLAGVSMQRCDPEAE